MNIQSAFVLSSLIAFSFLSSSAQAFGPESPTVAPTSRQEFCRAAGRGSSFKDLIMEDDNQLTFRNRGGMANGGVCWWHSRFQRLAAYLMVFRPELPRANAAQARWIINHVSNSNRVVEVPGYRNLSEFSRDYKHLIQRRLESWQREDAFLKFAWIKGLKGGTALTPASMRRQMDFIYNEVVNYKRIVWNKLQVRGIAAHAWLVIDMKKTADGYVLTVLDSNDRGIDTVTYHYGDTQISTSAGRGVPTVDNWKDIFRAGWAIRYYCNGKDFPEFAR